ncbi:hypothetical protein TNCV_648311 [Trichonephila clavipes]|uniref:Uncharacterized protein n=1 Tax=Trichonephila clavipes TaxID=2585209 RepID=A0A8X6SNP6_TRICX|nr:hypothetical protein TNCV_648311 [Trichonephila clavipes]
MLQHQGEDPTGKPDTPYLQHSPYSSVSSGTPKRGTTSRLTGAGSFLPPVYSEAWAKVPETDEISNVIEVVDLARQINLEVDSDEVQELLDSHNQELTIDELTEMHGQEQEIEELESVDPVQSEDRMTVGILTESLRKKGYKFKKLPTPTRAYFFNKTRNEKLSSYFGFLFCI